MFNGQLELTDIYLPQKLLGWTIIGWINMTILLLLKNDEFNNSHKLSEIQDNITRVILTKQGIMKG